MKLLCPACQKELTVPEQYAGQSMKCPMCSGTFTAPALPETLVPAAYPATVAITPEQAAVVQKQAREGLYGLAADAAPVPLKVESVAPKDSIREKPRETAAPRVEPKPAEPTVLPVTAPAGYEHHWTASLNSHVVRWLAPACLGIVFLLLFFPWVTAYWPREWDSMTGWGSAGTVSGVFYVLFFMLSLMLAVAAAVLPVLPQHSLPPIVGQIRPWKSAIVGGVALLTFMFLGLQFVTGFSKEQDLDKPEVKKVENGEGTTAPKADISLSFAKLTIHRTIWLWLTVVFHLLAFVGLGLEFWLERRGPKALPRLDVHW